MKNTIKTTIVITGLLLAHTALAWNYSGHRLIAEIAFQRLTPNARSQAIKYTRALNGAYRPTRFSYAASWPDDIKIFHDVDAFSHWHYINLPYGDSHGAKPNKHNVVWALEHSKKVLTSKKSNTFEKAMFLRFFTHFVGDIHQPLHCFSVYSKRFPEGDRGGSLYRIKLKHHNNLHKLWDDGGGFFKKFSKRQPLRGSALVAAATQLINQYPQAQFKQQLQNEDFMSWAQESYQLARQYSHKTPYGKRPSHAYLKRTQQVAERRVVLAGYRLARQLNKIFG